ncbi:hypothetical protein [Rhodococcus aerolatus]
MAASTRDGAGDHRRLELVRGTWGAACLLAPRAVLRSWGAHRDTTSVVVTRVLGVRHLTQAALSGSAPTPRTLAMGTWVDAVHSLTALALAVRDPHRARAGVGDAAVAALWAAAGLRDLRRSEPGPEVPASRRDRAAQAVLPRVPGGAPLLRLATGSAQR